MGSMASTPLEKLPDPSPNQKGWPWMGQTESPLETQPNGDPWPKISGSCWIEGVTRIYQHPEILSGHALEVMFPLEDGNILGQIVLVHSTKAA